MNRRSMLLWLAGGAVTAGLVAPVTRSIFLPPRGGWPSGQGPSFWAYSQKSEIDLATEIDEFEFFEPLVPVQMTYRAVWARGWSYPRITVEPVEGA